MRRRTLLVCASASAGVAAAAGAGLWLHRRFGDDCAVATDPGHAVDPDLLARVWSGLDPARVRDAHVHLAGIGAAGAAAGAPAVAASTGAAHTAGSPTATGFDPDLPWVNPAMTSMTNPFLFAHFALFARAGCALRPGAHADEAYVDRLRLLASEFPDGVKFMLFALDGSCGRDGRIDPARTVLMVPNGYTRDVARSDPSRFEWVASVNPRRPDAIERVRAAVRDGARALKWIPYLMDIDPAAPALNRFYDELADLSLPLIVHTGWQHELLADGVQDYGNPLRLRRALERGVRVIASHCATQGDFTDWDTGPGRTRRSSFELLCRLVDAPEHRARLFGDVSGIIDSGRAPEQLHDLLSHPRWHDRLVNGSDYPLPGVRVAVSTGRLVEAGLLDAALPPLIDHIQRHNPLLFDFVVKRCLSHRGQGLPAAAFECAGVFERGGALERPPRGAAAPAAAPQAGR